MDLKSVNAILADPPYKFQNWSKAKNGAAVAHYQCMSTEELCALPVNKIGGKNCALFLWCPAPKIAEGEHVKLMEAWNFVPKTVVFNWVKKTKAGKNYCGLGFWARSGSELCILGIRGKISRKKDATNVRQIIEAPVGRHSKKPDITYDRVQELVNGPYVELFARERREGWLSLGYELSGMKIDEEIEYLLKGDKNDE